MQRLIVPVMVLLASTPQLSAAEWNTWRGDATRSGYTPDALPPSMQLAWSYHPQHAPHPAWPRDDRMSFDRANQVVVSAGLVCFGSSATGRITAVDAESGARRWTFFTGGPVRFAPTVWKDRLFAVSDDGYLYCLKLATGQFIQRWRGGPGDDMVLGNSQMISKWPARGGIVIRDDILYWGAGIWQSEGVFLRAMNLNTEKPQWTNDQSGGIEMPQPHGGAVAKSGVSAQGYFLASEDRLFVPTGRAVPAAFTRATGEFEYYRLQENTQRGGTTAIVAGDLVYNGGYTYHTHDGSLLADRISGAVASSPAGIVHGSGRRLRALTVGTKETVDRRGNKVPVPEHVAQWETKDIPAGTSLIIAADTIVSSSDHAVVGVHAETGKQQWALEVDDIAYGLASANGRLFVSTASGAIHCYAEKRNPGEPNLWTRQIRNDAFPVSEAISKAASEILEKTGITEGYCVDLHCGDGSLACALARNSDLFIVGIEPDAARVAAARKKLDDAGLYGTRVTIHHGDPDDSHFPKYFANLIVSQRSVTDGAQVVSTDETRRLQRPYGGMVCMGRPGTMSVDSRGALDGAGEWTHLYSNPANTLCSTDEIKGPLTAVWFRDVDLNLPQRHGRGPSPLYYRGRLFAEGIDELVAVDAYNGRPLWRFERKGILDAYNADHLAGTAITGSNMCIADDSIFLRHGSRCFQLDTATGKVQATFEVPPHPDGKPATWGYIACQDGILFGSTANESHIVRHAYIRADSQMNQQFSESTSLFAWNVESGKLIWRYDAKKSIRHNAIAIGKKNVFLIDREVAVDDLLLRAPARRGEKPKTPPVGHKTGTLVTLDIKTGKPDWEGDKDIFGTALAFSASHDIILMFYQPTSFKLPSETGGRIAAFHASDGYRLWDRKVNYRTRPLINDDTIVAHPSAMDLVSGETRPLSIPKSYGCGQLSGSRNLLMFRSGTLGYYDFTRDAGTENYGGIRPGCWINALPVGGLVLVPDASAGCRCSYQNRSWVALEGSP